MTLTKLFSEHGYPKILIDQWNSDNKGYACYDFEESLIWDKNGLYLSGKKIKANFESIQNIINSWKRDSNDIAAVGYINYNFKQIIYPHINFKKRRLQHPYLHLVKPKKIFNYDIGEEKHSHNSKKLKLLKDIDEINYYKKIIDKIKCELENGNVYQINYSMLKEYMYKGNPLYLYLKIREKAKPPFGYYLNFDKLNILSFSPEQFFKTKNNYIYSYPMKGTKPRSCDINKDLQYKNELKNSIKDKAEHLMIVDLMRNDLGKISEYGSVKVKNLFKVQSYKTVHQMITEVSGKLKKTMNETDIIKALFPGGSITGAPKESAMKIIDNLENYNRNIYTGAIGFIKSNGEMNFNIAIRTMTINNKIASYPVGCGIVWDSNSIAELKEAKLKSKIIHSMEKNIG